jgi:hypothetical protein
MVPSIARPQEARRVPPVEKREAKAPNEEEEEEARKEELRRFVREKWKRIRELESQSSPGSSTEGEGGRRGSRASSVEYDPENPFDDDKNRAQMTETNKISAPLKKKASGSNVSDSSQRQKDVSQVKLVRNKNGAQITSERPITKTAGSVNRPVQRKDRPAATTDKDSKKERVHIKAKNTSGKTAERSEKVIVKRELLLKTKGSSEHLIEKSQKAASRVPPEGVRRIVPASTSTLPARIAASKEEKQDETPLKKENDTPTRRRKRRSEVPHYQPSAVVSLSADTSNALAELEASLARLKAHSDKAASIRRKARSPLSLSPNNKEGDNKRIEDQTRSRRSLSPAKEMRQMQLELEKQRGDNEASPPRISFLQRIEQKREEASTSPKTSPKAAQKPASIIKGPEEKNSSPVEPSKKKVVKRYSYTPTQRQPEAGTINRGGEDLIDESSCSIVIGDESIDDMIRLRKSSKFLASIRVFVDVRDQDGEDASSGWIEKLKSVGAKVYSKIPSSSSKSEKGSEGEKRAKLTHIVYKNGRPSTLHYLRAIAGNQSNGTGPAPPIVVGVNWILECLQQGSKVDEKGFLVEVGKQAIFNKVNSYRCRSRNEVLTLF